MKDFDLIKTREAKPLYELLYEGIRHSFGKINVQQKNRFSKNSLSVQPKLKVNRPNDIYEQEADAMADKVMRMQDDSSSASLLNHNGFLQRKCKHCEEEEKVQRKESNTVPPKPVPTENFATSLSGGKPLSKSELGFFGSTMGYDFRKVRLHTNSAANESAKNIDALAYTYGSDIVFGTNQYQPGTTVGKKLLAHELTYIIQQQHHTNNIQREPQPQAANKSWWEDENIRSRPQAKFWNDLEVFFPRDARKFSGSANDDVSTIECDVRGLIHIGKAYWMEENGPTRKAWIISIIEKRDEQRFAEGKIDNEDLTNGKVANKLTALTGTDVHQYITKLRGYSPFIRNEQVIAYLNGDEKGKEQILKSETEKLLDWKFEKDRLSDADLKDEKTNAKLRGLTSAAKLDKEKKAEEFSKKTGENTSRLQHFLRLQTTTSTPLPDDASIPQASNDPLSIISSASLSNIAFTMNLPNVDIVVLKDVMRGLGNTTSPINNLPKTFFMDVDENGLVKGFFADEKLKRPINFPAKLLITIITSMEDIAQSDDLSAYGIGTTEQDIKWDTKTLRFHEGSHGKGFIDYIRSHKFPSLTLGTVKGDDVKMVTQLLKDMDAQSCQLVDQVGFTQDEFLKTPEGKKLEEKKNYKKL